MPVAARCSCGAAFQVPDKLQGKAVKCPKCAQPVRIAAGQEETPAPKGKAGAQGAITVRCDCGKALKVPANLAGKAVKCPGCGKPVRVLAPAAHVTSVAGPSFDGGLGDLLDEVDLGGSRTGRRCPQCRADMGADDVVCINCGYHAETGKQIKTRRVEKIEKLGGVVVQPAKARGKENAPPAVQTLAKMLNQAGGLVLLVAILYCAYSGFQVMQENQQQGLDALIGWATSQGLYVIGGGLLLGTLPFAATANLVQSGNSVGRILSIVMGIAAVPMLVGILIIKLALSDEVVRYCKS